ncbi:MAG: class I SAM-dependent rRNA methyltransferase [Armatimonadetes bacterium]|nr:class I SAM-dependent rRNA methyltransferase [Armatimonadota bacterium]
MTLKPGRSRSVLQRHPWIFSGAFEEVGSSLEPGDVVDVVSHEGAWLARGIVNPQSPLTVRLMTWDETETIDEVNLQTRVRKALEARTVLPRLADTEGCRLVYGESDGLPGLIVDRYADYLAVQVLTPAMERWKSALVEALVASECPQGIYERSDVETREREQLPPAEGVLYGQEPPKALEFRDRDLTFLADLRGGQKTGAYLDQRENRWRVSEYCRDRTVLNAFSYTGAFGLCALRAGASHVTNLDTSEPALSLAEEMARRNEANGILPDASTRLTYLAADVFYQLRRFRDERRAFDVIVLDPPKFAFTKTMIHKATRAYKDINLLAIKLLNPGGCLATFSCSGQVSPDLFREVVRGAALDAGRDVLILEKLSQPPDHPVLATFPESEYLKGLICRVV